MGWEIVIWDVSMSLASAAGKLRYILHTTVDNCRAAAAGIAKHVNLTSGLPLPKPEDLFNFCLEPSVLLLKCLEAACSLMLPACQLSDLAFKPLDLLIVVAV